VATSALPLTDLSSLLVSVRLDDARRGWVFIGSVRMRGVLGTSDDLITLAERVRRLASAHHDPEVFHVEKSEIEPTLRAGWPCAVSVA
jgi:hypothetical protein